MPRGVSYPTDVPMFPSLPRRYYCWVTRPLSARPKTMLGCWRRSVRCMPTMMALWEARVCGKIMYRLNGTLQDLGIAN